eukprot:scaffold78196_cov23-Cyclotella_meneghiniana.AAC.1
MVDLIDGGVDDPLMQDNICWSIWESGSICSSLQDVWRPRMLHHSPASATAMDDCCVLSSVCWMDYDKMFSAYSTSKHGRFR